VNRGVLLAAALIVIGGAVVAIVLVVRNDDKPGPPSAGGEHERACAQNTEACIDYAFALMGRAPGEVDDRAAKDVLQRTCKSGLDKACLMLDAFEQHKLRIAEGRCNGTWFAAVPQSCLDAGMRHAAGAGTEESAAKAQEYFDKGCTLGHQPSCEAKPAR
jgi:TPR repeat protein